jgi:hypothetical protein
MVFPKFYNLKFVFRKINFRDYNPNNKVYCLIISNKEILIEITYLRLLRFYLVFENFVQIILVEFQFKVQILLNQVFKFGSKLFLITKPGYDINR